MPYNNSAIPLPEEITGQASLPLARVKKILSIDEDTKAVSNNASFVITVATEMFIRYLAEQALNVVKAEKKPRRNIQYKDLATAVARIDNLQFLEDIIPQTTTYREYKAKRASKVVKAPQPLQNGQTTLDAARSLPQRPLEPSHAQGMLIEDSAMLSGTVEEQAGHAQHPESSRASGNGLVFEHYEPNGTSKRDETGDIEMD
ncbi:hypothetical protein ACLMJK_003445 [Lecanora helva]